RPGPVRGAARSACWQTGTAKATRSCRALGVGVGRGMEGSSLWGDEFRHYTQRNHKKTLHLRRIIPGRFHALRGNARPDALRPVRTQVATLTSSLFAHRLAQVHIAAEPIPHRFYLGTIGQKAPMSTGPPRGGSAEVVAPFIRGIEGRSRHA